MTAAVGKKLANYEPSVSIAETDSEAKNWEITKGSNGNYNLKYSGNSRVKSLKAIQLVDLGIIVDGKKIMFSTTDAASKSWTEIENKTALPSQAEWQALQDNCYWERGTKDGLDGYYVYKKKANGTYSTDTDNYIFLSDGDYWSGTESGDNAYCTSVANEAINSLADNSTAEKYPIRLVKRKDPYVLLESSSYIPLNGEKTLTVKNPSNKTLTWKSSDETVAKVDENGKVTGLKKGTATITAFFEGDISTCNVTVVPCFTVSASGKKVAFSSGNLQYNTSTGKYQFAAHQWDYIGNTDANKNCTGTFDLFCWGTGDNPAQSNVTVTGFVDWGGKKGLDSKWYTLSDDEWEYIIYTRTPNHNIRYTKATIHGINGLVLLPDGWKGTYSFANSNTYNALFAAVADNTWAILEGDGAVFLPCAGLRNNSQELEGFNSDGYYWGSTEEYSTTACDLVFSRWYVYPSSGNRRKSCSVRLVHSL